MILFSSFGQTFADSLLNVLRSPVFIVFAVLAVGYLFGRINVKGVSFGSSGVFIVALTAGILLYLFGKDGGTALKGFEWTMQKSGGATIKAIKDVGLAVFVTGIGFIAGPTFVKNFKKKGASYITMGATATGAAVGICLLIIFLDKSIDPATGTGLLMGGLSTTPGLTSTQHVFGTALEGQVAAAYGLAYPFGVLGVVLFVQLIPKILRSDMDAEVAKLRAFLNSDVKKVQETVVNQPETAIITPAPKPKKRFMLDPLGLGVFAVAVVLGLILGSLTFEMGKAGSFSLGPTGGCIITGLLLGHFRHIGPVSLEVPKSTLNPLRELGLVLFLAASGIEGGLMFLKVFQPMMLLYGAIMTIVPIVAAYIVGRFAFKLDLLNNLGGVCGGMTSTPALGALIHVSKTDDVAQSYAAAYPLTLLLIVLSPQIIYIICSAAGLV